VVEKGTMKQRQGTAVTSESKGYQLKRARKTSEYGQQLKEKQKLKHTYGMRERQFRNFFTEAVRGQEAAGDKLLRLLEQRLDNVVYRLKLAASRAQARQVVVHGHILVNGKKVSSPSFLVKVGDEIALSERVRTRTTFLEAVVEKRMKKTIKPPEWLEINKDGVRGHVLRDPSASDIKTPIVMSHIIELYSK
jgi:small subunit ribosomal protein S4